MKGFDKKFTQGKYNEFKNKIERNFFKSKEYQRKYITVTIYQAGEKYNINYLQDIHEIILDFQNYDIKYGYSKIKKREIE